MSIFQGAIMNADYQNKGEKNWNFENAGRPRPRFFQNAGFRVNEEEVSPMQQVSRQAHLPQLARRGSSLSD